MYVAPDVPIPSPTGASVHVIELSESLGEVGHEVHVLARRTKAAEEPEVKSGMVTFHRVYRLVLFGQPGRRGAGGRGDAERTGLKGRIYYAYLTTVFALFVALVVSRIVKRDRIDVILERETSFGGGGLASVFTGRPLILEVIGPRYSWLSARKSRRILYYTESMLKKEVNRSKCTLVSAGVNLSLFRNDRTLRAAVRKNLRVNDSEGVVGYVGSFQDWHGVDTLFHAMKQLKGRSCACRLVLVGPFSEEHREAARKLGVIDLCTFVGPVEYAEVPGYVNACDVMVAPYNPKANPLRRQFGIGSPLKLLEYMACERPFVSTRVDPIQRIPSVNEAGILTKPGDPDELADGIATLIQNPATRAAMGTKGRTLVEEGYSWRPLAERVSAMIQAA